MPVRQYSLNDAQNDPSKAYFNTRHSKLRTMITKNKYGQFKTNFPVLRNTRTHSEFLQIIVVASCILHNIATTWAEEGPGNEEDDDAAAENDRGNEETRGGAQPARTQDGVTIRENIRKQVVNWRRGRIDNL